MTSVSDDHMPGDGDLTYDVRGDVGWIVFNRPHARNALTFEMYARLAQICNEADRSSDLRALVITGAGKAFAAGTDISQFRAFATEQDAYDYEDRGQAVIRAIEHCGVPTIAAIRGACTGGGAAIAAACDLRIGAPSALFGFPVARTLGNCLSIGNYARLAAIVGPARVREMILTARLIEAEEALRIGWLSEVVAGEDQLEARAEELAATVAGHAPLTIRATKMALLRIRDEVPPLHDEDLVSMCYMSDDFKEGVEAFLGKRRPLWRNR